MKRTGKKCIAALVLTLVFAAVAEPAAGDDCLKQGEFAVALAKRIRFDAASEVEAVENLAGMGIKPADGWRPSVFLDETSFNEVDRSVILAFAEGKLGKGSPSAARAVLAGLSMSGNCRNLYLGASPHPAGTPLDSRESPQTAAAQQLQPTVSTAAATPPPQEEKQPGVEEPQPGKKPHPYSPSKPWEGPTRPGPGSK